MTLAILPSTTIVLLVLLGVQEPARAQAVNIAGRYRGEGTSPDGTPYRALVEIAKDGETYLVRWALPDTAVGIGILRDDHLSVAYASGRSIGLVVYRIEKGPRLIGQWSVLGADGHLYGETLSRIGLAARQSGIDEAADLGDVAALSAAHEIDDRGTHDQFTSPSRAAPFD